MHSLSGFMHRKDQPKLTTKSISGHKMTTTASARPRAWFQSIGDWFTSCWGIACGCRSSTRNQTVVVGDCHEDEEHEPLLECQRMEHVRDTKGKSARHNRSSGASWSDWEVEVYVPSRAALSYLRTTSGRGIRC